MTDASVRNSSSYQERHVSGILGYQEEFYKGTLTVRMVLRDLLVIAVEKSFVDAIVAQVAVK